MVSMGSRFKKKILERSGGHCVYCGKNILPFDLAIDHVIPKHRGGKDSENNLVATCIRCNASKCAGDITELRWNIFPIPCKKLTSDQVLFIRGEYGLDLSRLYLGRDGNENRLFWFEKQIPKSSWDQIVEANLPADETMSIYITDVLGLTSPYEEGDE